MATVVTASSSSLVRESAELFREYRRHRWRSKNWGWFRAIFERGKFDDATVKRCGAAPRAWKNREGIKLARILERLSVAERAELRAAVRNLHPSKPTRKVYRRLHGDTLLAVSDFANLEMLLHENNKKFSEVLAKKAPMARELLINLLIVRLIVNISRMLDGAKSAGKETGSIEALIVSLEKDGFVRLGKELRKLLGVRENATRRATGVRARARRMIHARHQDVAHLDARAILDKRRRPSTTFAAHRRTIAGIATILERVTSVIFNETTFLTQLMDADIHTRQLLQALDKAP